uniref:WD_REPEATS_REGION domain-containing protein n=1 Tax=Panagrellus redivivus TaxID=6233 RepID=A0A7E4ZTU6_PANRE
MLVPQSTDANAEESEVLVVTWHSCRDFLACANCFSNDIGVVKFYSKQGGKLLYTSKEKTAAKPVQILWHPTEAVVVVGWDSGKVSLISPTNDVEADIPGVELSSIVGMAWDETANEILIADSEGRLATFQIDCNDLKKSSFKTKATLRDDRAVSIVLKKVKQKPSTASNPNRKLAKQETVNENDEEIFNAIAETKRHTNVASDETSVFVRDTTQYTGIFYIGTASGAIHAMDPDRILTKVFQCDTTVIQVLNLPETDLLFATTESMFFYQLIAESKSLQEKLRIKLTGKKNYFRMVMVDGFTVAVSYGEREIRVWDIRANDNSLFRLQTDKGYGSNDFIVCLAYSTKKNHISAGTIEGKIVRWKRRRDEETVDRQWLLQSAIETGANIRSIDWSPVTAALVVNAVHHVNIFQDEGNLFHFSFPYGVIWKKPQVLSLARLYPPHEAQDINLPFIVKGFRIATTLLTIWEETEIHIYEIKDCNDQPLNITTIASFSCSAKDAYVLGAVVVVLTVENKLEARTFQGTVRQTINFREVEGLPIMLDFSGKFMVVATSGGYLSIFDLTSRDLKPTFHSSQFSQTIPDFNRFLRVKVNSTGTRISFTVTLVSSRFVESKTQQP